VAAECSAQRGGLILASASAGRAAILRGAGLAFVKLSASIDERALEAEAAASGGVGAGNRVTRT